MLRPGPLGRHRPGGLSAGPPRTRSVSAQVWEALYGARLGQAPTALYYQALCAHQLCTDLEQNRGCSEFPGPGHRPRVRHRGPLAGPELH
eukprot:889433-Pyramimonas_sp.AAC.1